MGTRVTLCVCAVYMAAGAGFADAIRIDGTLHDSVYVSEGQHFYFVMAPADGSVRRVAREDVQPGDVTLTEDKQARQALMEAWKAKKATASGEASPAPAPAASPEPPSAPTTAPLDSPQASRPLDPAKAAAQFEMREGLQDLLEFEAELERWREFTYEQRRDIVGDQLNRLIASRGAGAIADVAAAAVRAEAALKLSVLDTQAATHVAAIEESQTLQARQTSRVLNNPRLTCYQDMLEATLIRRTAEDLAGDHNPYTDVTVNEYAGHVSVERQKAAAAARGIAAEHDAFRQTQQQRLDALNRQGATVLEQKRAAELEARHLADLARRTAFWAGSKLERLAVLEAAAQNDYRPRLPCESLGSWQGAETVETEEFVAAGPVWKVDLRANGAGRVRVQVVSIEKGRLVNMLTWRQAPVWDFLVLDRPDRYRLVIETAGAVSYSVEASQVGP